MILFRISMQSFQFSPVQCSVFSLHLKCTWVYLIHLWQLVMSWGLTPGASSLQSVPSVPLLSHFSQRTIAFAQCIGNCVRMLICGWRAFAAAPAIVPKRVLSNCWDAHASTSTETRAGIHALAQWVGNKYTATPETTTTMSASTGGYLYPCHQLPWHSSTGHHRTCAAAAAAAAVMVVAITTCVLCALKYGYNLSSNTKYRILDRPARRLSIYRCTVHSLSSSKCAHCLAIFMRGWNVMAYLCTIHLSSFCVAAARRFVLCIRLFGWCWKLYGGRACSLRTAFTAQSARPENFFKLTHQSCVWWFGYCSWFFCCRLLTSSRCDGRCDASDAAVIKWGCCCWVRFSRCYSSCYCIAIDVHQITTYDISFTYLQISGIHCCVVNDVEATALCGCGCCCSCRKCSIIDCLSVSEFRMCGCVCVYLSVCPSFRRCMNGCLFGRRLCTYRKHVFRAPTERLRDCGAM